VILDLTNLENTGGEKRLDRVEMIYPVWVYVGDNDDK
jgi:hypothetical protein